MDGLDGAIAAAWRWLAAPMSGAQVHVIDPAVAWHARIMVVAWGALMPVGAMAARFLKVTPAQDWPLELDNRTWWRLHLALQYMGVAMMIAAAALVATGAFGARPWTLHAALGWAALALGLVQVVGGWLRGSKGGLAPGSSVPARGDHYDMTPRRIVFERVHKSVGWVAIGVAAAAIAAGLVLADAPRWMSIAIGVWWVLLGTAFTALQRAGRCVDTYQAIWGPSIEHPGNRRQPIGIGVRLPTAEEEGAK